MIGSLRELLPPNELTQDVVQRALLVGWCIELVRACCDKVEPKKKYVTICQVFLMLTNPPKEQDLHFR